MPPKKRKFLEQKLNLTHFFDVVQPQNPPPPPAPAPLPPPIVIVPPPPAVEEVIEISDDEDEIQGAVAEPVSDIDGQRPGPSSNVDYQTARPSSNVNTVVQGRQRRRDDPPNTVGSGTLAADVNFVNRWWRGTKTDKIEEKVWRTLNKPIDSTTFTQVDQTNLEQFLKREDLKVTSDSTLILEHGRLKYRFPVPSNPSLFIAYVCSTIGCFRMYGVDSNRVSCVYCRRNEVLGNNGTQTIDPSSAAGRDEAMDDETAGRHGPTDDPAADSPLTIAENNKSAIEAKIRDVLRKKSVFCMSDYTILRRTMGQKRLPITPFLQIFFEGTRLKSRMTTSTDTVDDYICSSIGCFASSGISILSFFCLDCERAKAIASNATSSTVTASDDEGGDEALEDETEEEGRQGDTDDPEQKYSVMIEKGIRDDLGKPNGTSFSTNDYLDLKKRLNGKPLVISRTLSVIFKKDRLMRSISLGGICSAQTAFICGDLNCFEVNEVRKESPKCNTHKEKSLYNLVRLRDLKNEDETVIKVLFHTCKFGENDTPEVVDRFLKKRLRAEANSQKYSSKKSIKSYFEERNGICQFVPEPLISQHESESYVQEARRLYCITALLRTFIYGFDLNEKPYRILNNRYKIPKENVNSIQAELVKNQVILFFSRLESDQLPRLPTYMRYGNPASMRPGEDQLYSKDHTDNIYLGQTFRYDDDARPTELNNLSADSLYESIHGVGCLRKKTLFIIEKEHKLKGESLLILAATVAWFHSIPWAMGGHGKVMKVINVEFFSLFNASDYQDFVSIFAHLFHRKLTFQC